MDTIGLVLNTRNRPIPNPGKTEQSERNGYASGRAKGSSGQASWSFRPPACGGAQKRDGWKGAWLMPGYDWVTD